MCESELKKRADNWLTGNDGSRTLTESTMVSEVTQALKDWIAVDTQNYVLIGGLALSYWAKPRTTQDIDLLFLSPGDIPDQALNFKRVRPHCFQHNDTHCEVEVLDPVFLNIPSDLTKTVYDLAVESDGMRIASKSGLIALKLFRFSRQDQADIESLIKLGDIDLSPYNLSQDLIVKYNTIANDIV